MKRDSIRALRQALQISPDNVPLRMHLSETLQDMEAYEEAEEEYRRGLSLFPNNIPLKTGIAGCFYKQGKYREAIVVIEDILAAPDVPAEVLVLHAQVLLRMGEVQQALNQYREAVSLDPDVANTELESIFGIGSHKEPSEVVDGRIRLASMCDDASVDSATEKSSISFRDVGGMKAIIEEIRIKIISPLTNKDLFKAYGKTIGGGILMYGPPGCGKTYLARATAGEIRAPFFPVGLHDVLDMWIGQSEQKLHEIFERARENPPSVLFFDEVDALGASRSDMRYHAGRHLINQFLAEMDGMESSNEGVLILAATNAPWHVDPAFRRPGRFDRILFVPPPDTLARMEILKIHIGDKPSDSIDFERIASRTQGFSGADLKSLIDIVVEDKLRQAMQTGSPVPIATNDMLISIKRCKLSTKDWFATARNYALYSNESGLYDDILSYLKIK